MTLSFPQFNYTDKETRDFIIHDALFAYSMDKAICHAKATWHAIKGQSWDSQIDFDLIGDSTNEENKFYAMVHQEAYSAKSAQCINDFFNTGLLDNHITATFASFKQSEFGAPIDNYEFLVKLINKGTCYQDVLLTQVQGTMNTGKLPGDYTIEEKLEFFDAGNAYNELASKGLSECVDKYPLGEAKEKLDALYATEAVDENAEKKESKDDQENAAKEMSPEERQLILEGEFDKYIAVMMQDVRKNHIEPAAKLNLVFPLKMHSEFISYNNKVTEALSNCTEDMGPYDIYKCQKAAMNQELANPKIEMPSDEKYAEILAVLQEANILENQNEPVTQEIPTITETPEELEMTDINSDLVQDVA